MAIIIAISRVSGSSSCFSWSDEEIDNSSGVRSSNGFVVLRRVADKGYRATW